MTILTDTLSHHFKAVRASHDSVTLELEEFPINKTDIPAQELDALFQRNNVQPKDMHVIGPDNRITRFVFAFDGVRKNDVSALVKDIKKIYGNRPPIPAAA